jgi:hypothetical protein
MEPPGLRLARAIKKEWPQIPLVCLSNIVSADAVEWFKRYGIGYFHKHQLASSMRLFLRTIEQAVTGLKPPPSTLIVHGHADRLLGELKDYLVGELQWSEVRALKEIPSTGRTVLQKFSDEAQEADLIFMLLSPEDITFASADQLESGQGNNGLGFELGHFLGSSNRRQCKVVVLMTAGAALPLSAGEVAVIDASAGLPSVQDRMRLELLEWIP